MSKFRGLFGFPLTLSFLLLGGMVAITVALTVISRVDALMLSVPEQMAEGHIQDIWLLTRSVSQDMKWIFGSVFFSGFNLVLFVLFVLELRNKRRTREMIAREVALAGALRTQNAEIEAAHAERGRLLANVTHELNTPMASVLAFCQILARNKEDHLSGKELESVAAIRRNAEHMSFLVRDMISLSEIEGRRIDILPERIAVDERICRVVESLQPIASESRQTLRFSTDAPVPEISADPRRIDQAVTNIITNSMKYSPEDGVIDVHVGTEDGYAYISVTDEGPGIEAEDIARVWEPFYRSDNEITRSQSGTGLGLSIVLRVAELHGGTVEVCTAKGEGTCVRMHLPLVNVEHFEEMNEQLAA